MPLKFNPLTGSLDLIATKVEPAGSDGQIQFNDGGSFGASSNFSFNMNTNEIILSEISIRNILYPSWTGDSGILIGFNDSNINVSNTINPFILIGKNNALNSPSNTVNNIFVNGAGNTINTVFDIGNISIQGSSNNIENADGIGMIGSANNINIGSIVKGSGIYGSGQFNNLYGRNILFLSQNSDYTGENLYSMGNNLDNSGIKNIMLGYQSKANNIEESITLGFGGARKIFTNNKNRTFLFGFNLASQQNLLEAEYDKGVRIGATSGETITMTGEDLYVVGQIEGHGYTKNITTKTAAYTLAANDDIVVCSGTFTITLPLAGSYEGKVYTIKNKGTGTITVDGDGAETIDGSATQALIQHETITIISDGTEWWII